MKVSVIIPTYQRCKSVQRLLSALLTQTFPHSDFEVIVSIDGSDDGTLEMVENFVSTYKLRFIWEPNSGRAKACNRGIYNATGEILIILDDDMEPSPNLVQGHYLSHLNHTKLGVMGAAPILINDSSTMAARYIATEFNSRQKKISDPSYKFKLWDFYGANFSIRRTDLLDVKGFNESFKIYGEEDIELAFRLVEYGIKFVFQPDALCTQHYENDFRVLALKKIEGGMNGVLFVSIHPEVFSELYFRNYNKVGWKWRSLRIILIWSSILIPFTKDCVIAFVKLFEKTNSKIQDRICHYAIDYFLWLGIWTAIKKDNNQELLNKIKTYRIPKKKTA